MSTSAEKIVRIVFQGDDRVSRTIQGIESGMMGLSGAVSGVASPLAQLADGILKADAALAALAVGGLVFAYKKSMDFESASAELAKVLGDEIGRLGEAQKQAKELSNQYGRSATSVLDATASFKQAGYTVSEAMGLTKASLDLAIAGELGAADASEILVASLKGFKAPASEAARLVDVLNEVSNNYATDVEQLGIGMAALSPIASKMGFSFEETAGILTPVIEVFRSGDEAAMALKTGLLKLLDDSKPVREGLARLGVAQMDANGHLRSGKDILHDVAEAFKTAEESDKLFLTQQLVGIDQSARMVEVFDGLAKQTDITATAMGAAGSAAKEVETRLATSEIAVQRFGVAFENAAISMGDQFRDAATEAVNGGTEILNTLEQLADSGAFDELFNAIEDYGEELGAFLKGIARAMPEALENVDWSKFVTSVDNVVSEVQKLFSHFFDGADLTTAEGLAHAIQKVIDAGASLNNVVAGIIGHFEHWAKWAGDLIDKFGDMDEKTARVVGDVLGLGKELNVLMGLAGGATQALSALANVMNVLAVKHLVNLVGGLASASAGIQGLRTATIAAIGTTGGQAGLLGLAGAMGWVTGSLLNEHVPAVGKAAQALIGWVDGIVDFTGKQEAAERSTQSFDMLIGKITDDLDDYFYAIGPLREQLRELGYDIEDLPAEAVIKLAVEADLLTLENVHELIETRIPKNREVEITTTTNVSNLQGVSDDLRAISDEIERSIPDQKSLTVVPTVDRAAQEKAKEEIKNLSDSIEAQIKRDVAIIEAEAQRYTAMMENMAKVRQAEEETTREVSKDAVENYKTTTDAYRETLQILGGTGPYSSARFDMLAQATRQNERLDKQVEASTRLEEAMAKYYESKTDRMESGEAVINVQADGLKPHLEMILWEILEAIQIRATEEYGEFLLGI